MTLCEAYEYTHDSQNIRVISCGSLETLGIYDGKNSIENIEQKNGFLLNDCEVEHISAEGDTLILWVNDWF